MLRVGKQRPDGIPPGNSLSIETRQFWILAVFLCLIFATGGSTWPDEPHLILLRPAALLVAAYALLTMQPAHWRHYRAIWMLLGSVVALTVLHLIPLPPEIWKLLPGRDIITEIDNVAGLDGLWRPLSMVPEATRNAAYSLAVPIAVALLAAQLDDAMHKRLLLIILALAIVSGVIGLVQTTGASWHFYDRTTTIAGVFINRNHQALLLAMIIPMTAAWAALQTDSRQSAPMVRFIPLAVAIIIVPLILLTGSRSGVITGGLGVACLPLFWPNQARRRAGSSRRNTLTKVAWIALVLVIGIFCYAIAVRRETALDRLHGIEADLRFPVWSSIVDMLGSYLPWGSGIGSYEKVYQILEPASLLRPTYSNHAHNEWLEIALTAGVPGLAILAAAGLLLGLAAWRSLRTSGVPNMCNRLGVLVIFMLAIASTADYPVRTPILSAVLALAAIWATPARKTGDKAVAE